VAAVLRLGVIAGAAAGVLAARPATAGDGVTGAIGPGTIGVADVRGGAITGAASIDNSPSGKLAAPRAELVGWVRAGASCEPVAAAGVLDPCAGEGEEAESAGLAAPAPELASKGD
jgi:hypothetical protein